MKQLKMLLLTSMVMFFTACGGGSSSGGSAPSNPTNPETPQTIAIAKIMLYANDNNRPAPTVEDYADAGVTGVTSENLDDVNNVVADLTPSDVDTPEEIQKVVDDLGINILPTANAGPDQNVMVTSTVILNGSTSNDPNGDPLSYSWTFVNKPSGSNAELLNRTTVNPTFIADIEGVYAVTLIVNDGTTSSAEDTVEITATTIEFIELNESVLADDGLTVTVTNIHIEEKIGSYTYTINYILENKNASGSIDEGTFKMFYKDTDGGLSQYGFFGTLYPGDTVSKAYTFEEEKEKPFNILAYGDLFFSDNAPANAPQWYIDITSIENLAPAADAGPDLNVQVNETITITGIGTDSDGTIVSYSWRKGTTLLASTASFDYTHDTVGTYTLTLTVTDDNGLTATDSMNVTVTEAPPSNNLPVADAGSAQDIDIDIGETVTLDGSGSSDADGDNLAYQWSFVDKPNGSTATLSDASIVNPTFIADVRGSYKVQLVVSDGNVDSAPDTVTVEANNLVTYVSNTVEFRQALLDAAQNGFDDKIILADGIYKTTDDGLGTFKFLDSEDYQLFILGTNKENVILSGANQNQIFNHLTTSWNSRITLDNLTFEDGLSVNGGAVYIDKKGTILNCIFSDNNATSSGGGFYSSDRIIVKSSTFLRNNANSSGGGFYSVGTADLTDCTFTSNTANSNGGGFATGRNDTAYVLSSIFKNNSAGVNGGGFSSYWTVVIKNSVFASNSANGTGLQGYGYGGGFISTNANAKIENSIFVENNATNGGGVFSAGRYTSEILNTLFLNNNSGIRTGTATFVNNTFVNNGVEITGGTVILYNNYIDESKISASALNNGNIFNGINLGFVDQNNEDYHLTINSDLIDAGINSVNGVTVPKIDLDGNPRPAGASTDIGPYEYQY